jgi:hypothetical protein
MVDLLMEQATLRRSRLRLGIFRYVTNGRKQQRHLSRVRFNFASSSDEEFEAVVNELLEEGVLAKTIGRNCGVKLSLTSRSRDHDYS